MAPKSTFTRATPQEKRAALEAVLERCSHGGGGRLPAPVCVFDLDGTLMDNRPRTVAILREYSPLAANTDPTLGERLSHVAVDELSYLLSDTLHGLGIHTTQLERDLASFWRERFFSDGYLKHDVALRGAVSFVEACHKAGATIVYLTGRDLPLMGLGTFQSLRDLGFPIGVPGTELVLKPDASMPDEAYKRFMAPVLVRVGPVVAHFDNEPANCNVFVEHHPSAEAMLVDTQHMPGAPPLVPAVRVIDDFAMDP